jgi:hypothetical protein
MSKRPVIVLIVVVALVGAWYAFRPERLFVNQTVSESFPAGAPRAAAAGTEPTPVATGRFHGVAHDGKGVATVYQLPDGKRVLRLTEFETSNGPDLQLYLVAAADAADSDAVKQAGFLTLGALKGNQGDQNYELPAEADLGKYRAVTVWCRRFGVNFTTAPLTQP